MAEDAGDAGEEGRALKAATCAFAIGGGVVPVEVEGVAAMSETDGDGDDVLEDEGGTSSNREEGLEEDEEEETRVVSIAPIPLTAVSSSSKAGTSGAVATSIMFAFSVASGGT